MEMPGLFARLGQGPFLLHPFQLITYKSLFHLTLSNLINLKLR
jgi:hypothetical protein